MWENFDSGVGFFCPWFVKNGSLTLIEAFEWLDSKA
jgi:hypothetical protein